MSKYTNLLNEQMKESLESYIIEHALAPGDALPSERELAENLGVNRLTIRAALKRLRNEHRFIQSTERGILLQLPKSLKGQAKWNLLLLAGPMTDIPPPVRF